MEIRWFGHSRPHSIGHKMTVFPAQLACDVICNVLSGTWELRHKFIMASVERVVGNLDYL